MVKNKDGAVFCSPILGYSPMHEVVPRVVAMAVRMVITKCRIFCQSSLFIN